MNFSAKQTRSFSEPGVAPISNHTDDNLRLGLGVVMPCHNEADTLEICIQKAQRALNFDRDAKTLTHPEARRLLKRAGFQILRTAFLFIFLHLLRWLRPLETPLTRLPFGAQYQILCRKA